MSNLFFVLNKIKRNQYFFEIFLLLIFEIFCENIWPDIGKKKLALKK